MAAIAFTSAAVFCTPTSPAVAADEFTIQLTCDEIGVGSMSRSDMLTRSSTWIDARIPYSQARCYRNSHGSYRTDCSGYVSMVWGLPTSATTLTLPNYSSVISRSDLKMGDIFVRHDSAVQHTAIFIRWADTARTSPVVREQAGPDGSPTAERTWSASYANTYTPRRYNRVVDSGSSNFRDFNGDGKSDIAGIDPGNTMVYFAGNGAGRLYWGG
ncbi:hypothetical protein, partial [Lentzea albidocapillata]